MKNRPIPGVMIAGRFYPSANHCSNINDPVVFRGRPVRISDVQAFYNERADQRRVVSQMHTKKGKRYSENCAACQYAIQRPQENLYFDYMDADDEVTDDILDGNPFNNRFANILSHKGLDRYNGTLLTPTTPVRAHSTSTIKHLRGATAVKKAHKIMPLAQPTQSPAERLGEDLQVEALKQKIQSQQIMQKLQNDYMLRHNEALNQLLAEKTRLSKELLATRSREELNFLRSKLRINQQMIDSIVSRCQNGTQFTTLQDSPQRNSKVGNLKEKLETKQDKQNDVDKDDLEPSVLQVIPEPMVFSSSSGQSQGETNSAFNSGAGAYQKGQQSMFANCYSIFHTAQPKTVIVAPEDFSNRDLIYKYDPVSPYISFGRVTFRPSQLGFLRSQIKKFDNQLEKNVFWSALCYICAFSSKFVKNQRMAVQISRVTIQIPCAIVNRPKCCLVRLYTSINQVHYCGIAGIPFVNKQPVVSKIHKVRRVDEFDFEVEFMPEVQGKFKRCLEYSVGKIAGSL